MSSSQPRSGSNKDTSRYVRMLISLGTLPEWHNALSAFFVSVITTGFIIVSSSFVTLSEDGTTYLLTLKVSLFVIGYLMVTLGASGMSLLAYRPCEGFEHLWANNFWAFHRFYQPAAQAGIIGLVSLLVVLLGIRQRHVDAAVIIGIIVACWAKIVFGWYTAVSYAGLREARKEYWHEKPQPPIVTTPEDPYLQMLFGFATLPRWFGILSHVLIGLITVGLITIPLALLSLAEDNNPINGDVQLIKALSESEPLFAISITISFVSLIAMFLLSRYQYRDQIPFKENHYWLFHKFYWRVATAGIYGLISLLLSIFVLGNKEMNPPTVAAICIMVIVTALFGSLASWSYIKTRQTRMAYETRLNISG